MLPNLAQLGYQRHFENSITDLAIHRRVVGLALAIALVAWCDVKVSRNRIDCHGTWLYVYYSFVLCSRNFVVKPTSAGATLENLSVYTYQSIQYSCGVRHSWQRLWIVRQDVWPLVSVLSGSASLSG